MKGARMVARKKSIMNDLNCKIGIEKGAVQSVIPLAERNHTSQYGNGPMNNSPKAPPLKTQGIKTKLLPFIWENINWSSKGKWVEPFVGSGAVLFNVNPARALVADTNEHIIEFYKQVQSGGVNDVAVRAFLQREGQLLYNSNGEHYYQVRDRFNRYRDPFDFIFLTRACFNGLMRFNRRGEFNTPFCKKPNRFSPAYITKICNQIKWVSELMMGKDWEFVCADWKNTLANVQSDDFVYADPPYVGRFTDYFNVWSDIEAKELEESLKNLPCQFLYSMWAENRYRRNEQLFKSFDGYKIKTFEHYYHLGATEDLRSPMLEALVS